jgi:hypothetical protein
VQASAQQQQQKMVKKYSAQAKCTTLCINFSKYTFVQQLFERLGLTQTY